MLVNEMTHIISNHKKKKIPFSKYMELLLYHPKWGYYNQDREKIGKSGDFYTSSSVGKIFGEMWTGHFIRTWERFDILDQLDEPLIILEVGGGTGEFALTVLETIKDYYSDYYSRVSYYMVEQSQYHRRRQASCLEAYQDKVIWFNELQDILDAGYSKPTIIFSNELFDALPVERVKNLNAGLYECWVEIEGDQLKEVWIPLERDELLQYLISMNIELPLDHEIEIPLAAKSLFHELITYLNAGSIFTVDYGWRYDELLRPERKKGTLIGYSEHKHVTDFYQKPGTFDLTSHVHFEALIKWGKEHEIETYSYLTQREWLLSEQVLSKLVEHQDSNPFSDVAKRNRSIVQLISPGGMGDTFKVLTQIKR